MSSPRVCVRRGCRRRAAPVWLLLTLASSLVTLALSACGTQASQLAVTLTSKSGDQAKPGDTVSYVLAVVNKGPGPASNVHLAIDLPANFHYTATPGIDHDIIGAPRLTVTDPQPKATSPTWGTWNLAAPSTNADGTTRLSNVDITFTAQAGGDPGDYRLQPHAGSDQDADVAGTPVAVHLDAAAQLQVDVSANPTSVTRGKDVLYRVTVDNFGTGPAGGVSILVTLPDGLTFLRTEQIQGNAARDKPSDPVVGTLEAFYGGFSIPAKSDAGPGSLILVIRTHCGFCANGTYTVSVQITDDKGVLKGVSNAAPVQVSGAAPIPGTTPPPPTAAATPPPH